MRKRGRITWGYALTLALSFVLLSFPHNAFAGESYKSFGVEGFHDDYKEPSGDLTDTTNYGSLTGSYTYYWDNNVFAAVNGRASYGTDNYSSISGTSSGAPQYEFELRARAGKTYKINANSFISPYGGLGLRYFVDEGEGNCTNLGFCGYDRYITQLYAPIGATYVYITENDWTISPNVEVDPLLYGNVNSDLSIFPNELDTTNIQKFFGGYGLRGELMFGKVVSSHTWQVGPFVRYWNIRNSELSAYDTSGDIGVEPNNTRTQIGIAARVLW